MENYGTMEKTMVLWTKLWYYTENYRTSICKVKKHGRLPYTKKLWFIMEQTLEIYQNKLKQLLDNMRTSWMTIISTMKHYYPNKKEL